MYLLEELCSQISESLDIHMERDKDWWRTSAGRVEYFHVSVIRRKAVQAYFLKTELKRGDWHLNVWGVANATHCVLHIDLLGLKIVFRNIYVYQLYHFDKYLYYNV